MLLLWKFIPQRGHIKEEEDEEEEEDFSTDSSMLISGRDLLMEILREVTEALRLRERTTIVALIIKSILKSNNNNNNKTRVNKKSMA